MLPHHSQSSLPQPHSSALSADPLMTGRSSPGNSYSLRQLADFHLDQLDELGVVDEVHLVHVHDDVRHVDLVGEQDVLARLRHGAVVGAHHEDRGVHLGRARDHVLDVVGMARAVDVRVVALVRLVLDVRRGDGDAALALFRRLVDHVECGELGVVATTVVQRQRDRSGERGLAVVDVTDGAHVHVRLAAVELLLGHVCYSFSRNPEVEVTQKSVRQSAAPKVGSIHRPDGLGQTPWRSLELTSRAPWRRSPRRCSPAPGRSA